MLTAADLRDELFRLEQLAAEGQKLDLGARVGRLLERLLKFRLHQIMESGKQSEFTEVVSALSRPLDAAMLGTLIRSVKNDPVVNADGLWKRLWSASECRNWACHDKNVPEPHFETLLGAVDTVWQLCGRLGITDQALRGQLRREVAGLGRRPASSLPMGLPPVFKLDRMPQRNRFDAVFPPAAGVLVVAMHGERGQGHSALSDYCLRIARDRVGGVWTELGNVGWPDSRLGPEERQMELSELLTSALEDEGLRSGSTDPADGLRFAWDAAAIRPFVRHRIRHPCPADGALIEWYLRHVWERAARESRQALGLLSIEFSHATPAGFWWSRRRRLARQERSSCEAALERLASMVSSEVDVLPLAELAPLTELDILVFLASYLDTESGALKARAEEIFLGAGCGRFEEVWRDCSAIAKR